jgi:hypothetical protein
MYTHLYVRHYTPLQQDGMYSAYLGYSTVGYNALSSCDAPLVALVVCSGCSCVVVCGCRRCELLRICISIAQEQSIVQYNTNRQIRTFNTIPWQRSSINNKTNKPRKTRLIHLGTKGKLQGCYGKHQIQPPASATMIMTN